MKNLATDVRRMSQAEGVDLDAKVEDELRTAGIEWARSLGPRTGEVPTRVTGTLAGWSFTRAWYYWVAVGRMPVAAARRLYAAGNRAIRCGGHGCAPPPDEQVQYLTEDGRDICTAADMRTFPQWHQRYPTHKTWHPEQIAMEYVEESATTPRDDSTAYVTTYHIDTQEALNEFAVFVRSLVPR